MPNANDPADKGTNAADGDSSEQPQPVTEERVAQIVNAAVSSHLKRSLGSAIAAVLSKELEPIKAKLAAPAEEDKAKDEKPKASPEIVALQKQLADMQAAFKAKDEEVASEKKRARDDRAFSDLVAELTGKVRPGAEKKLARLLRAEGALAFDDDGNPVLKVRTALAKGQSEQDHEFPIADGVGHYLKTKDAALFLPPPNQGGAGGDRRVTPAATMAGKLPKYDAPPTSDEEKARRTAELFAAQGVSLGDL